jgi:PD-(D/E)XK nuclease superfamily
VTGEPDAFQTPLPDVDGTWPPLPEWWSYSSLTAATECPRRWMLARASYPSVWERSGYPPRPGLPALAGSVIHGVLETVVGALHAKACGSVSDPQTVAVLKELGGYSSLLERAVDRELGQLDSNPRAVPVRDALATSLRQRIPEMRQRVQAVVARVTLNPAAVGVGDGRPPEDRLPLPKGTHPEVELRVPALRFTGRADLLSLEDDACTLTDYKTGSPDPHHIQQLRLYALLWSRDEELNPAHVLAERLVIAYATHDEEHEGPSAEELDHLASALAADVGDTEAELSRRPPPAKPAAEMCRLCAVRHLCDDYWPSEAATANSPSATPPGTFVDCETSIVQRNGPRSWLIALGPEDATALLRTPTEAAPFRTGDRVRLLDVVHGRDEDSDTTILTMTQTSEAYVVRRL